MRYVLLYPNFTDKKQKKPQKKEGKLSPQCYTVSSWQNRKGTKDSVSSFISVNSETRFGKIARFVTKKQ